MQNTRYLIAVPINPQDRAVLQQITNKVLKKDSDVVSPHITIVPPFFLTHTENDTTLSHVLEVVSKLEPFELSSNISELSYFHQLENHILVGKLAPKTPFVELNNALFNKLKGIISLDTSRYSNKAVPKFDPHVTLSYDAFVVENKILSQVAAEFATHTFKLDRVELLMELEFGKWVTMGSNH